MKSGESVALHQPAVHGTWRVNDEASESACPKVLPIGWRESTTHMGAWHRADGLTVISSVMDHEQHGQWLHVSCSYPNHLPDYEDLRTVKRMFVGRERGAFEVHAAESRHVNIHPYVRHLWCRLDAPCFPDFTCDGQI